MDTLYVTAHMSRRWTYTVRVLAWMSARMVGLLARAVEKCVDSVEIVSMANHSTAH